MINSVDIVIVGAGATGLTLALALARQTSLKIAIIDSKKQSTVWEANEYHLRVSAINLASVQIFKSLGIWHEIKKARVSLFKKILVTGGNKQLNFDAQSLNQSKLGFIIENNLIESTLLAALSPYKNVKLYHDVYLTNFVYQENATQLESANHVFQARLAIAADGANSWLRQQIPINLSHHYYQQSAIVTHIQTQLPHKQIARQFFAKQSVLALLPLQDLHHSSIVWSLPIPLAQKYLQLTDDQFQQQLALASQNTLGKIDHIKSRIDFSLYAHQAKQYIAHRFALIGDAAHHVHPLAGQGLNMGLLDAASLAEIILQAEQKSQDFAQLAILRKYERWRKADHFLMVNIIHQLQQFFNVDMQLFKSLSSLGIQFVEKSSFFKNIFMRHACGLRADLPFLAREAAQAE